MNTDPDTSQALQDFVLEHRDELATRLNLDPSEASALLAQLGGSLCRRLFPEQKHRDGLQRLQQIIDHLGEGVVVSDLQGELLDWNPAALRIHGFSSVDEVRRNLSTFAQQFELCEPGGALLSPQDWPLARLFRGETVRNWVLICRRPEINQVRYIRYNGAIVPDDHGQSQFALLMLQDLTDQYQAHLGQLKLSKLLRAVSEATHDALFVKDLEGRYTWLNQATARFVGKTVEEVLGRDDSELFDATGFALLQRRHREIIESGASETSEETLTARGETRTFLATKAPYLDEHGQVAGIIGISRDITAQKLAEKQLFNSEKQFWQAQKMEAIGRLAGGVAHDFNNQLTIILGNCDLVLYSLAEDNPDRELLLEVYRAGERTARLTRQLLAFSRLAVTAPTAIDLNSLVAETARMLEGLVKHSVTCSLQLGEQVGQIQGDPTQLEQLLMNLISNACDAMPQGGRLTLSTARRWLETPFAGLSPGSFAVLTVTDTGVGVSAEIRDRIFDPFFTTKGLGQGTGLGLAVAHGIVEQLGGAIQLESHDGSGTSFHCWFPAVPTSARPQVGPDSPLTGSETILVIEDEAGVRKVARLALESKGYSVLEASSGAEAVNLLNDYQGPLHCILSDVVMPGMSGPQAVETIRARRPDLPVVFMSGYLDETVTSREELAAGRGFVQKPFSPLSLAKTIRQVLDGL